MFTVQLLLLSLTIQIVFCTDYCDKKLCGKSKHIGCKHSGKFASSCPSEKSMVDLNQGDIDQILDLHNTLRNKIASGGEKGFKSASKMSVLKWDTELAALAELNVKQCKMKHDQCRATSQFPYAGQNLGVRSNTADYEDKSSVIKNVINAWYDEIKDAKSSNIAKCCGPAHKIGHFTQVVRDEAVSVGCAISKYADKKWKNLLMACNYSITNMVSQPVYAAGSPASGCSTGGNGKYTSLCN